jgi:DNA helicase-4
MSSAVERYKQLLSGALTRYFPRTMAYLRAERAAALSAPSATPAKKKTAGRASGAAAKPSAKPRKPASEGLYGPEPLAVDEAQVQAMRERVAQAVAAAVVSPPSDEQWAMILGRRPLTRIFAGAGSGKSSTLVLRVVFMLCHMQIDPARLTVISFTNASCAELRERLLKVLAFWQYPLDAAQARQCVRTFHSAMGLQAKALLQAPVWFEQLDDKRAVADELDNPLAASRLGPAQQHLLKQAYLQCYAQEPDFRERVHRLLGLPPLPLQPAEGKPRALPKAPLDPFTLAGEFSALPLFEAFYVQAGFMQSIGLRLDQLRPQALKGGDTERCFIEALLLFWTRFEALLQEEGLLTFNGAFQRLTQNLTSGTDAIPPAAITPLSHLLIDEFQDISPQIVQWLQAVHRALVRQGETVSLMAVGDDWQSIYGWRGSSPELFIDFDKYFPGRGRMKKSTVLTLATNYRSIEPVIRDGEAVLAGVQFKQEKLSQASKALQPGDHGVKLVQRFDVKARMPDLLAEIQAQCEHVASRAQADRTAVLVLSRGNELLRSVQAQLDKKWPVKTYTIHRAKGLQAEVAIILDDCLPPTPHPLRNLLYAHSGFFRNSYDQAMQDEGLRLAYVAITRGVSRVLWFTRKAQGATQVLAARRRNA